MTELTEPPEGPDMRANAWIHAWDRIEAAQNLKKDHRGRVLDPLPELYWATIEEARILAQLALSDESPARDVGTHLVHRADAKRAEKKRTRDAMDRLTHRRTTASQRACCPTMYGNPHVEGCDFEPRPDNPIDYDGPVILAEVPPFSAGHRVKLLRGDQAGRIGEVTAFYRYRDRDPDATGPTVDVDLEPTERHARTTTTVPATDVEFVG